MWMAVFADVGVSVLAVLNAMRTLYYTGEEDCLPA
jgi:cation transport ATPase